MLLVVPRMTTHRDPPVFEAPSHRNYNDVTTDPEGLLALAMQTESTEVDNVVAACTHVYAIRQIEVETLDVFDMPEGRTAGVQLLGVAARTENRIECVIPRESEVSMYTDMLDGLARTGWDVWVLVPTEMLGAAHRHLRGVAVTLQPWWDMGTAICFGRPEIP